jgi:hypothetical protein
MTRRLVFWVMAFWWHSGDNVGDFPPAWSEFRSVDCIIWEMHEPHTSEWVTNY